MEKYSISKERLEEKIQQFTLLDDTFMRVVFKDEKMVEFLIRIILENKNLVVQEVQLQVDYKNLHGKSAILDIVATDENNKIYNIEIQRDSNGATPTRARYHSSLLDVNISSVNKEIKNLPETYVIFITQEDVLQGNKQIYHIDRIIRETNKAFNDKSHIIYVNASMQTDSDIGRLMHDFKCENPNNMYYEELSSTVKTYKETEKGRSIMCRVIDDLVNEGRIEGRIEGKIEGTILTYKNDFNISRDEAIEKMSKNFLLSNEEATIYVDKYYN